MLLNISVLGVCLIIFLSFGEWATAAYILMAAYWCALYYVEKGTHRPPPDPGVEDPVLP